MPLPLLRSFTTMLSRLEAEESIVAAEQVTVGAGLLKAQDRTAVLARWRQRAQPDRRPVRAASATGTFDLARRAGIGVRRVGPRPATGG